ncbi:MAG: hypothetical protein V2I46_09225 [Bacteroides sp.]|jgi:hypothetical protein|nr:hypothetical protein [Bacteroides sp.]
MKTKLIISATLIFAASFMANASAPKRMLTVYDQLGRKLSMPVKVEEAADTFPFDQQAEFKSFRATEVSRIFDLSEITKPEVEDTDIPVDLESIFKEATK